MRRRRSSRTLATHRHTRRSRPAPEEASTLPTWQALLRRSRVETEWASLPPCPKSTPWSPTGSCNRLPSIHTISLPCPNNRLLRPVATSPHHPQTDPRPLTITERSEGCTRNLAINTLCDAGDIGDSDASDADAHSTWDREMAGLVEEDQIHRVPSSDAMPDPRWGDRNMAIVRSMCGVREGG